MLPRLHAAGLETIVLSLRGCDATRFAEAGTVRSGNHAMLALDAIALLDALAVDRFMVARRRGAAPRCDKKRASITR